MRASLILFIVLLVAPTSGAPQPTIRPGQYEVMLDMDLKMEGAEKAVLDAAGFKNQKRLECITPEDVKDTKDLSKLFAKEMEDSNCKMSDVKTVGNKMSFTTTCVEDDMRMTTYTEMTFGPDSFSGTSKGKDHEGREMTMKMSAKRLGDCPK